MAAATKQLALAANGMPERDDELEAEGVRLINATNALQTAKDCRAAALKEIKAMMREAGIEEYTMFDATKILRLKHQDDKVVVEDIETGEQDK